MTEQINFDFINDEVYTIVFNDIEPPRKMFGIFKERKKNNRAIRYYELGISSIDIEPYFTFIDFENEARRIHIEEWEIECGMIEIFQPEIPIK